MLPTGSGGAAEPRDRRALCVDACPDAVAQHLETSNGLGYVVLDIGKGASTRLFRRLREIEGTIRARILY